MNNKRNSYHSGNSKGFSCSVPGIEIKDQVHIVSLNHISLTRISTNKYLLRSKNAQTEPDYKIHLFYILKRCV